MFKILLSGGGDPVADPDDHPTSRLVERVLGEAVELGASDVHVAPTGDGGEIRFRIDGAFEVRETLSAEAMPRVVARMKVLAGLAAFRTGEPQDGRIELERLGKRIDLRLSTVPVLGGEKAVVRIFDAGGAPRSLEALGFAPGLVEALKTLVHQPAGLVFVVGPCSSGKTTTLYALAREILATGGTFTNVVSAEDPVEQTVAGMSQSEVDLRRGVDFPTLLKALLRQDPEVLFVTETRDAATARLVVEAGFTGHRVFTSIHVAHPGEILRRLEALDVPPGLAREALRGAVSQRLLRRVCAGCEGRGCDDCRGRGFSGRFAVGEVVHFDSGEAHPVTPTIREEARRRVAAGETTGDELTRVLGSELRP